MRKFMLFFILFIVSKCILAQVDTMNTNYQQGVKNHRKSKFFEAYYFFNKALLDEPNLAKAYYYKADILERLGEDSLVILMLNKAIQLNPNYIEAYYYKARFGFSWLLDNPLTNINKVIELDPQYADAYMLRSMIYSSEHEFHLSLLDINKAIAINPKEGYYFYLRGSIKESLKDKDGACMDYSTAKKMGFNK
jgi:tetratricopeptide (TPR) repeat protein